MDSMKTINLELSEDSAREMLTVLARKKSEHQSQIANIDGEMRKIKQSLGMLPPPRPSVINVASGFPPRPEEKTSAEASVQAHNYHKLIIKTPHGRVQKGQSQLIIRDFLEKRNGAGTTIKEITAETGTVYGTARRVLDGLKKEGLINEDGGLWKWGKSEFV
jgi:hypothetical protein